MKAASRSARIGLSVFWSGCPLLLKWPSRVKAQSGRASGQSWSQGRSRRRKASARCPRCFPTRWDDLDMSPSLQVCVNWVSVGCSSRRSQAVTSCADATAASPPWLAHCIYRKRKVHVQLTVQNQARGNCSADGKASCIGPSPYPSGSLDPAAPCLETTIRERTHD